MSTPHGPNPGDEPPPEQPAWGGQPPGGWGQPPEVDDAAPSARGNQPLHGAQTPRGDQRPYGAQPPRSAQPSHSPQRPHSAQPPYGAPLQSGDEQGYGGRPAYRGQQGSGPPAGYGGPLPGYGGRPAPAGYGDQPSYGGPPGYGQAQYGDTRYDDTRYDEPQSPDRQPGWGRTDEQAQGAPQRSPGYPPLPEPSGRAPDRPRSPLIVGGAAVGVVALVLLLGFVTPGFFVTEVFDPVSVQDGVGRILTEDYDTPGVSRVSCADDMEVEVGATYECAATIDGEAVRVPITVTGDDGSYQVGRPI